MISALYVVLAAMLLLKLSFDVVRLRMEYRIATGDGGSYELQTAIRVHGNAVEYLPIGCLLLIMMEMNGAEAWMVHVCGLMLIVGRLFHYYGLKNREFIWRRNGMAATYISLLLMVVVNIIYLPWSQFLNIRW
ncbi:MAPEG family inner membrane protein [Enterobacterales bacterium]|nr:MAPEG family inner membrane protein [Enterobacterales bacterium]